MAKQNKKLAEVFHFDLYGKRQDKYDFLNEKSLSSIDWNELENREPDYFFVPKDWEVVKKYEKGFSVSHLFIKYGMGITTGNDKKLISFDKNYFNEIYEDTLSVREVNYRLFDTRINYDNTLIERGRKELMSHLLNQNIGLISLRGVRNNLTSKFGIVNNIVDKSIISTLDNGYVFPLYLYPNKEDGVFEEKSRKPNLNLEIVEQIVKKTGLKFVNEKTFYFAQASEEPLSRTEMAPIDILDYIYAVLHSPTYREKYKEFLKIDFPRVPYPKNKEIFWQLVKLGGEIRKIHLLESPKVEEYITSYPIDGDNNITTKIAKKDWEITDEENQLGRIWLNETQYFDDIPLIAWEFYIGGYQPAQKWLKDRKGRSLSFEDILHYQKIIVALYETDRLMKEIDKIEIE